MLCKILVVYNNAFTNFLVVHTVPECWGNNSVLVTERRIWIWLLFPSILFFAVETQLDVNFCNTVAVSDRAYESTDAVVKRFTCIFILKTHEATLL